MGSVKEEVENRQTLSLTVTCSKSVDPASTDVLEVEVGKRRLSANFGYLDPKWAYEE